MRKSTRDLRCCLPEDGNTQMKWKQVYWSTETIAKFMEINFFFGKMFSPRKTHKAKHSSLFILYTFQLAPPTPQSLKLARTSGFSLIALSLVERL
ncbi:hypothetical protein CMV_026839 [Castanea mollissima]|uniref:Uncharacterized protein n=1 Tax=Castanea mollissima TaxID=60419 RepID=A0A8J4QB98_9ROSI|nr:hypothetical protein CMV_026839 [Castanea mollissima]